MMILFEIQNHSPCSSLTLRHAPVRMKSLMKSKIARSTISRDNPESTAAFWLILMLNFIIFTKKNEGSPPSHNTSTRSLIA